MILNCFLIKCLQVRVKRSKTKLEEEFKRFRAFGNNNMKAHIVEQIICCLSQSDIHQIIEASKFSLPVFIVASVPLYRKIVNKGFGP